MYSEEERVGDLEMLLGEDLHAELVDMVMGNCGGCDDNNVNVMMPNPSGTNFDAMGTATNTITAGREIWQVDEREQRENLLDVNDSSAAIFYDDQFPVLPDFSCMSSSSSSSSTPAPTKPIHAPSASSASTSSSAASWALLRSDGEEDVEIKAKAAVPSSSGGAALSSTLSMEGFAPSDGGDTIDCMDVMENFGYMDLLDSNDIWDPSCIFDQNPQEVLQQLDDQSKQLDVHNRQQEQPPPPVEFFIQDDGNGNSSNEVVQDDKRPLDEMGEVFFQWLKSHKDTISAEDMRNIKIKRSTVECATKRLGSSKEGQKQLLKLILDWVGQYQLRKKSEAAAAAATSANQLPCPNYQEPPPPPPPQTFQNPNPIPNYNYNTHVPTPDPNSCFSSQPWIPPAPPMQPYMADPTANVMSAPPPPFPYIGCDPYNHAMNFPNPYNHGEYQMLDSSQPWNQSQMTMRAASASQYPNPYPDMGHNLPPGMPLGAAYVAHDQQYPYPPMYAGNGDQMFMRLGASATKEARKKRMARQRRLAWNHPRHQQQQNHQNQVNFENCQNQNPGNWGYWPPAAVAASDVSTLPMIVPPQPMDVQPQAQAQQVDRSSMQVQNGHKQTSPEKRQGLKSEKNLKFLLQKVLKQSDVGNLGRIVLPKKEAETHLPELETRDGISISMEDIGTSRVWNMRYRFWPNNKSRMYLLENTGDFVKANELQEGDFIVLYSDMKCGKYLIRGVKVRQPGMKPEGKKPAKRNQRNASQGGNGAPASPSKKQQKEKQKQTAGGEPCDWKQKQTGGETCN